MSSVKLNLNDGGVEKTMKRLLSMLAAWALALSAVGVEDSGAVRRDIDQMTEAFKNNDLEVIIEMTYPPMLEAMGGKEAALAAVRDFLNTAAAKSYQFHSFEAAEPFVYLSGTDFEYVIVPFALVAEVQELKIRSEGYQLGVKKKEAKDWKYVDGQKLNDATFEKYFPDFPDRSKLPPIRKKVLEE